MPPFVARFQRSRARREQATSALRASIHSFVYVVYEPAIALCLALILVHYEIALWDVYDFLREAVCAFVAAGAFVLLCAIAEVDSVHWNVRSFRTLNTMVAWAWLHHELWTVFTRLLTKHFPRLFPSSARFERWNLDVRARFLNVLVKPRDLWPADEHEWVGDTLRIQLGDGRVAIIPLPDAKSLNQHIYELVKVNAHQRQTIQTLQVLWDRVDRLEDRQRSLEQREAGVNQRIATLVSSIHRYERRIEAAEARNTDTLRRFILVLRVYHVIVWRRMVILKTQLSRTTQDYNATQERLSVLSLDYELLEDRHEAALEEKEELLLELAEQDDKLCTAQEEIEEWQTVAEGVCFSHAQELNEFKLAKASMHKSISVLMVGLHVLWRFSMALKAKSAARACSDREDKLALRRRLVLVEAANLATARDLAQWRTLYEESDVAVEELVGLYTQQRATYQVCSRRLLTGLLILWRYSRTLGQELFEARFRMHMCPVSCRPSSDDVSMLPISRPLRALLPPADSMEGIDESGLTADQILSLRFSRTNIAYASLSVQYEQLHAELDDVYDALDDAQQEREADKEKLQSDLADARKAVEDLRTDTQTEAGKLRQALEEAKKTIEALRTAKDTAETELQNKRNEMVLARATVKQMRAEVEETKRNLESRVVEWGAFAARAASGRPMLLSEPRDNDDLLSSVECASASQPVAQVAAPLDRQVSPPMLMERRDRALLLDTSNVVIQASPMSSPIERKLPGEGSSSLSSHLNALALADLHTPKAYSPSPSPVVSSVIGMPGAIDFPDKPVPFRPSIGLYSGSPRVLPIAQPRPVSAQQSLARFTRPRTPRVEITSNASDSDDESPVESDASSSPEQEYFTPALPAAEF